MTEVRTGWRLCQEVRYEFSEDPLMAVNCYCRDCQRVTGSAVVTVLALPRNTFHLFS